MSHSGIPVVQQVAGLFGSPDSDFSGTVAKAAGQAATGGIEKPPASVSPSDPATSAAMSAAEREEDKDTAGGMASTMLTGGGGLFDSPKTSRATLLGS